MTIIKISIKIEIIPPNEDLRREFDLNLKLICVPKISKNLKKFDIIDNIYIIYYNKVLMRFY